MLHPGDRVDQRFVVESLAGHGGMGVVYRARDERNDAPVALKVLRSASVTPRDVLRLEREGAMLAALSHPGIVRVIARGTLDDEAPYIALEWLDGESLEQRLRRGPLEVAEALELGVAVATALASAHATGIIHRDIKPSNLFLRAGAPLRSVVLLDFGIAVRPSLDAPLSGDDAVLGSVGYLAPEQARGEAGLDPRADVFALGCVLFHCLAGSGPYDTGDALAALLRAALVPPPRVRERHEAIDPAIDLAIARAMAFDREQRPRDGAALAALLRALTKQQPHEPLAETTTPLLVEERRMVLVLAAKTEPSLADRARSIALQHGASVVRVLPTLFAATFEFGARSTREARSAREIAMQTARCALALKALGQRTSVAIALGAHRTAGRDELSLAVGRCAQLVTASTGEVLVDDAAVALLRERFELSPSTRADATWSLRDAQDSAPMATQTDETLVARDWERSTLLALYRAAVDEQSARVVLVTGASGMGKSLLVSALRSALARDSTQPTLWFARAIADRSHAPLSTLRRLASTGETSPEAALDEALSSASDDAALAMRSQGERERERWLRWAERTADRAPLVIVIDDAQHADEASLSILGDLARRVGGKRALLVVATTPAGASDERLQWNGVETQRIALAPLSSRASSALVRRIAPTITDEPLAVITARSAGNPLVLEELAKTFADGGDPSTPSSSVSAMSATSLAAMPDEQRRLLRAASVFADHFDAVSVAAVLGDEPSHVERALRRAREAGVIIAEGDRYAIRHESMREAAYASIVDDERVIAHGRALSAIEQRGDGAPEDLAEHAVRGGMRQRIGPWLLVLAERSLRCDDLAGARQTAQQAIDHGLDHAQLVRALLVRAEASIWLGEPRRALDDAQAALEGLAVDDARWARGALVVSIAGLRLLEATRVEQRAAQLIEAGPIASRATFVVATSMAHTLSSLGRDCGALFERVDEWAARNPNAPPAIQARTHLLACERARTRADLASGLRASERAAQLFETAGLWREACVQRVNEAAQWVNFGRAALAEAKVREALARIELAQAHRAEPLARLTLSFALLEQGRTAEAESEARRAHGASVRVGDARLGGFARALLARSLLAMSEHEEAEREARAACDALESVASLRVTAEAALADVLFVRGRQREALAPALRAAGAASLEANSSYAALVLARVLHAIGRREDALRVATEALRAAERSIEGLDDTQLRASSATGTADVQRLRALVSALT